MYGGIRKSNIRQETDRSQWAELQATEFEFEVTGLGEALTEPIYFGRAYDRPPLLNFSSVGSVESVTPHRAIGYPSTKIDKTIDRNYWDGTIVDPQFEVQMFWGDPYIPDLSDHFAGITDMQVIHYNETGVPVDRGDWWSTSSMGVPGYANRWFQTRTQYSGEPRWSVSTDVKLERGPRPGIYSAKYTFDDKGTSRKLGWLDEKNWYDWLIGYWGIQETDSEDTLWINGTFQFTVDVNLYRPADRPGGYLELMNPPNNKLTVEMDVYSTSEALLLFEAYTYSQGEFEEVQSPVGGPSNWVPSKKVMDYKFEEKLQQGWQVKTFEIVTPSWLQPNVPDQKVADISDSFYLFGNAKISCQGSPGESVYLGRVQAWPNTTTLPTLPFVMVGVSEWVVDDSGAYVGAILWLKSRTPGVL